jgi:Nif-specific regulatory protein
VKLLRVLESGTFSRIGGDRPIKVDVRIVAASNRDLDVAVAEGRFREDLLYRLRVFPVHLPPLRDRRADLILLVDHFLAEMSPRREQKITAAALDQLRAHDWPGTSAAQARCSAPSSSPTPRSRRRPGNLPRPGPARPGRAALEAQHHDRA